MNSELRDPRTNIRAVELPLEPLVVIEMPSRSLDLYALWQYRELLYVLTVREVKVRYKQSALGIMWAVIQPLSAMLIFTFLFGVLAAIPSDGIPYMLFAYVGLVPWTFFSNAVSSSGNSLVGNSSLITKVYFPRMIIPLSAVCAGLIDLTISFALLIPLLLYFSIAVSLHILMLPVLILLTVLLASGFGMWMAALNVKYRDVRHALPFIMQLWMFLTPIIYPSSFVPDAWRWVLLLNPMTGLIEGYRSAVFGTAINLTALAISTGMIFVILIYALNKFSRTERSFADIV